MKLTNLSAITDVIMGQSPPSSSYNTERNGLPFFQGKAEFGKLYPEVKKWCDKPTKIAQKDDILISVRAPVGPTNLCSERVCIGRGLAAIRPKNGFSDKFFILYFLRSIETKLAEKGKGSTFSAINRDDVERIKIPDLSYDEQKKVADILFKAESALEKRREAIHILDNFLKSTFLSMFGDPISNLIQWPRKTIGQLGRVVTGSTPPSKESNMFGGDIPFVTPGDLENIFGNVQRNLTVEGSKKSRVVRKGSALVCCIGATIGKIDIARMRSAFNQQINAVEWFPEIDDYFGLHLLRFFKPNIIARGTSTTLPILKKSAFEKITLPVPLKNLQIKFSEVVEHVERLKQRMKSSETELQNLFNCLMQKAFKGKLF